MSTWTVVPRAGHDEYKEPHVGRWRVDVGLAGSPRGANRAELPVLGRAGPSSVYDVRECETLVRSLSLDRMK